MCLGEMVIRKNRHHVFNVCPGRVISDDCCGEDAAANKTITVFDSRAEARAAGWKQTDDIEWCGPDHERVWVCPECIAASKDEFYTSVKYVPVTPGGSMLINLAARMEEEAWEKLMRSAAHMPYGSLDAFIARGYTIERIVEK